MSVVIKKKAPRHEVMRRQPYLAQGCPIAVPSKQLKSLVQGFVVRRLVTPTSEKLEMYEVQLNGPKATRMVFDRQELILVNS